MNEEFPFRRSLRFIDRLACLALFGCAASGPDSRGTSSPAPRAKSSPQLALRHGEDFELLDPETGDRWITSWHGGSIACDVVGDEAISADGRFAVLATAPSGTQGAERRFTYRIVDVARRTESSSPDFTDLASRIAFSNDGSSIVLQRHLDYSYSFQTYPIRAGEMRGAPGPVVTPSNLASPAATLVSLDGRRAYVLVEKRNDAGTIGTEVLLLDLVDGGERVIDLRGSATTLDAQLVEEPATGALLASTWHFEPDGPLNAPDVRFVHDLFRVDVAHGTATLMDLPQFAGLFAAGGGRVVAACRDGQRTRLVAVDLKTGERGFVEDGGVLDGREVSQIALAADGRRVTAFVDPPTRVESDGSIVVSDAPGFLLAGDLGEHLDHDAQIAPLAADVLPTRWRLRPLEARRILKLSFSPDRRWLAIASGGYTFGADTPMPAPSWVRVVDLEKGRVAQRIDLDSGGPFPCLGWCVPSNASTSE